ncbi:MAG: IS21-like element helper ATPase IstB [Synergistaceae bacterium]|jgi:DNA replication protein DnaC
MNEIANELKSLRMPGMAQCWLSLQETRKADSMSFSDGLQLLLQSEQDQRKENRNARLIKDARFRYQVYIEDLILDAARGVERDRIMRLATCEYIRKGVPVTITGASGTGKSWLGTALGYQACLSGYKVAYFNMQKLFEHITMARIESSLPKFFERMAQTDLLILDDFGMKVLDGQQLLDFMEIIEDRHARKSTIMISQLPIADWYDVMKKNTTAADAILDRIIHTAQRFELLGDTLRKK